MVFDPRAEYQDANVAAAYDQERFTSLSGRVFQWAERRSLNKLVRLIPRGSRILDAPCGTGRLMDLFLQRGLAILGGDISAQMMGVARRRTIQWNGRVTFARMDFAEVPLIDKAVTATFSMRFLPHIEPEERVRMLREFRRVSERWIIISLSLSTPWHRLRRRLKDCFGLPKPVRHPVTNSMLSKELAQAGLREVLRVWTCPVLSEQVVLVCERIEHC